MLLAKPVAGDTDWATEINQNWTDLESSLTFSSGRVPFSDGAALTSDPGLTFNSTDDALTVSGYLNVGTTTNAAAQGDFSAGLTGANRVFFDQSAGLWEHTGTAGDVEHRLTQIAGVGQAQFRLRRTAGTTSDWYMYLPAGSTDLRFFSGNDKITFGIAGGSTVFNEQGDDTDFRVEGDTETHLLFVDASLDAVMMGTSAHAGVERLQVRQNGDNSSRQTIRAYQPTAVTANGSPAHIGIFNEMSPNIATGIVDSGLVIGYAAYNYRGSASDLGTLSNLVSLFTQIGHTGTVGSTAVTTAASAIYIEQYAMAGTIDAMYGLRVVAGAGGGTLTSSYAIHANPLNATTAAQTFAFFSSNGGFNCSAGAGQAFVFNESGVDADFRIEGDTDANLFFVDASNDCVAVGRSGGSSAFKFMVQGTTPLVGISGGAANETSEFRFYDNSYSALKGRVLYAGGNGAGGRYFGLINSGADYLEFGSDTTITTNAGFTVEYSRYNTAGFIFNNGGLDLDFRVAGDTDANLLLVDAGTDRIGIGHATPAAKVHVSKSQSGLTTLGGARVLILENTSGSLNEYQEIGLGFKGGATNQPILIGTQVKDNAGNTKGNLFFATRDVTTDTVPTLRWEINSAGGFVAGGNHRFSHGNSALATNATEGFFHLQSCAGTPTGTPASIPTGQIPMVFDSTNKKLYVYEGGAWKRGQVGGVDVVFA